MGLRLAALRAAGAPLISSNGHPTKRISEFVDCHLKPLVQTLPSFIKDTTHFLLQLQKLGPLPDNAILVTLDVSSLYTNTPHNEGVDACRYFLNTHQDKSLPAENMCDLIKMILTMNNFSFNNGHYLQKHGTAMGTSCPIIITNFARNRTFNIIRATS